MSAMGGKQTLRGVVPCTNVPIIGEQSVAQTQRRPSPRRGDVCGHQARVSGIGAESSLR